MSNIVTVIERIPLKPQFSSHKAALKAGRAYELVIGPNAHDSPGWAGHASFFFEPEVHKNNACLILIYPWYERVQMLNLLDIEENIFSDWLKTYASGPRVVSILDEIPVET